MALPSSPPPLPDDSPTLLPIGSPRLIAQISRKRQLSEYDNLSSDPLFSEDASEAELLDSESAPKRKRLVRGPWWSLDRERPSRGHSLLRGLVKRTGELQNVDSGVWMGSDDSVESTFSGQSYIEDPYFQDTSTDSSSAKASLVAQDAAQNAAATIIQTCLEHGKEVVDLSDLGLTSISSATLRPLHQLVRQTYGDLSQPPSEDEYIPLTPLLQLYLSGNRLRSLPPELFNLASITVLSLRNNNLFELPPSICRLKNLKEFNVAGNQLLHLPWELLDLLRSSSCPKVITLTPNPLLGVEVLTERFDEPMPFRDLEGELFPNHTSVLARARENPDALSLTDILQLRFINARYEMFISQVYQQREIQLPQGSLSVFIARSRIYYLEVDGSLSTSDKAAWKCHAEAYAPVNEDNCSEEPCSESTKVPSLFESALRRIQGELSIRDVCAMLPDHVPPAVSAGLAHADTGQQYGNNTCSTCGKAMIIPRAQWVEYWCHDSIAFVVTGDNILPFLRKACSWGCAEPTIAPTLSPELLRLGRLPS